MGQTISKLAERPLSSQPIFPHRFVIECCEKFHFHWRNLRLVLSTSDFISLAEGCAKSLDRWKKNGSPEPTQGTHIELTRKEVAKDGDDNRVLINLNRNLYNVNEGRVFAQGANFNDKLYVHLKLRDIRLELSFEDFKQLAEAVKEADEKLNVTTN